MKEMNAFKREKFEEAEKAQIESKREREKDREQGELARALEPYHNCLRHYQGRF